MFYSDFFGTGVALDFCLAILYNGLWLKFAANSGDEMIKIQRRNYLFRWIAGLLFAVDIIACIWIANLTNASYKFFFVLPIMFVLLQVVVIIFLSSRVVLVIRTFSYSSCTSTLMLSLSCALV